MTILFGPQMREVTNVLNDLGLTAQAVVHEIYLHTDWTSTQAQECLGALGAGDLKETDLGDSISLASMIDGGRVVVFYPKPACDSCKAVAS